MAGKRKTKRRGFAGWKESMVKEHAEVAELDARSGECASAREALAKARRARGSSSSSLAPAAHEKLARAERAYKVNCDKSPRLGSAPETHRFLAQGYAHSARISAQNLAAALRRGDCKEAAAEVPWLIGDASAAQRERRGAGTKPGGRSQMHAVRRSLYAKFVKQCVKTR
jgi:hypothetical protein